MSLPRRSPLAILLPAAAVAAYFALATGPVPAQTAGGSDSELMRPALDGDPQNPPRFRRRSNPLPGSDPSRFGGLPSYDYKPAVGAGSTGFDSSNVVRKAKNTKKPSAGTVKSTATTGTASAKQPVALVPPLLTPAEAGRLTKTDMRRGGPGVDPALLAANAGLPQLRRLARPDEKPFDPTGVQVGSFLLRPALEITRGYDTNPNRSIGGAGSWLWVAAPELLVNSNWGRHELTANVKGNYTSYDTQHQLDRPSVDGKVNGRIDVTTLSRIDLEGRLQVGTDRPGSPNIQADLSKLPIFTTFGASVGWGQQFNRFEVTLKGGVDRTVYQNSHFVDGSTESNRDRQLNQYSTQLRTSYDVMPGLKPFVEVGADQRRHDVEPDRYGLFRDSTGYSVKAGSTFEFSRKLTGEAALGYLSRSYKDATLSDLSGMTADASLVFAASALTTAKLTATTTANETTVPGIAGIFTREVALQVDHAFRRWLLGTAKIARALEAYEGSSRVDHRYLASGALTYMLSREWQIKAEIRREWRTSNTPGNEYLANIFLLGVRMQR